MRHMCLISAAKPGSGLVLKEKEEEKGRRAVVGDNNMPETRRKGVLKKRLIGLGWLALGLPRAKLSPWEK